MADPGALDWDDIRCFLAVARAASLTEAARRLKVSQPTVGRRLAALETRLGLELVERGPGPMVLSAAGRELLALAERMEESAGEVLRLPRLRAVQGEEPVRVTAIASLAVFLVRRFEALRQASGGADLEIISTGERLSLARNEADIALRMGRLPRKGDLTVKKIGRIAYAPYGRADVESGHFVGYRKNPKAESQSSWLYRFGETGQFPLRVNELQLRFEAAKAGLGTTLLPCHLGDAAPELARLDPPPPELVEEIYLLRHAKLARSPRIGRVADALAALVRDHQGELMGE